MTLSSSTSKLIKPHHETGSYWGSLWMVLAALSFTLMSVLVKMAGVKFALHEYELVFWRVLFASVVLGVQAWLMQRDFSTQYPKAHFWRSLFGSLGIFMFFYSLGNLPLATAITFNHTSAIFLALLSVIILKQIPSRLTWFALILGLIGVIFILRPSILQYGVFATLIGLCSGAIAGYAYLQVRELSLLGEPSWRIVFYFSTLATILAGIASSIKGWSSLTFEMLPYLLGIGFFAMVGQLAMTYAYKVGRKFMVAALGYLVVVFSTLFGIFVFNEPVSMLIIIGMLLIIVSGIIAGVK